MDNFKTIQDVKQWVKELGLHIAIDVADTLNKRNKYVSVMIIQSDSDRDTGIYPVDLSPAFLTEKALIKWANKNKNTLENLCEVWDVNYFPEDIAEQLKKS